MKREIRFFVIGGQYRSYNYGGTYTLEGAKRLATKHEEYWDNWQGWHKPVIYKAESCNRNGRPEYGSVPYMAWNGKRWEEYKGW